MSSRSMKTASGENHCPACGKGVLERDLVSKTFEVDGHPVTLDGLMPYRCPACLELTWPESEARRIHEAIAILSRKAAA